MFFRDFMDGGARPFSIGGVICLVNSVNERDPNVLNSLFDVLMIEKLLRGTLCVLQKEGCGNNRSVMPLDNLGRTCATLMVSMGIDSCLDKRG